MLLATLRFLWAFPSAPLLPTEPFTYIVKIDNPKLNENPATLYAAVKLH
jgi:hypothetical protein